MSCRYLPLSAVSCPIEPRFSGSPRVPCDRRIRPSPYMAAGFWLSRRCGQRSEGKILLSTISPFFKIFCGLAELSSLQNHDSLRPASDPYRDRGSQTSLRGKRHTQTILDMCKIALLGATIPLRVSYSPLVCRPLKFPSSAALNNSDHNRYGEASFRLRFPCLPCDGFPMLRGTFLPQPFALRIFVPWLGGTA